MSSTASPISASQFASALVDLPFSVLYAKAAEIRNSIAHLERSNNDLTPDADSGDKDCQEAITENLLVIERMQERIGLLRKEVERRGGLWHDAAPPGESSNGNEATVDSVEAGVVNGLQSDESPSRLNDEDGVHL